MTSFFGNIKIIYHIIQLLFMKKTVIRDKKEAINLEMASFKYNIELILLFGSNF